MASKILIVEDEQLIALDIRRQLLKLGYEVIATARDADTAFAALTQEKPDLILLDVVLHGKVDGTEIAAQVQSQYEIPIVFLTAHADEKTLQQAKAAQPFGYLVKPVNSQDLSTAIEIALTRHRAELAIKQALAKEKALLDLKSQFVSMVSHEFRNPLSTLQFSFDLLESYDNANVPPEKRQACLQRGKSAVKQMLQLLQEVMVIGEAESGKLECRPEPLNLLWFCHEVIDAINIQHQDNSPIIHFNVSGIDPTTEPFYYLDIRLLRHILTNLLSNAVKYSPAGSPVIFDLIDDRETLTFRVQDYGIGIPLDDQVRLFESFYRGSNVKQIPGTGLGLAIVNQSVKSHNGTIRVESQVGQGSIFVVTLKSVRA
ncbi:signal transduction histidine kinase [Leptolyngbyaceae cyanobacterium JSC-12]|nr:signal transduction histidine kinase [Leptolyngbyaceae cyanobacterium JSC-12]